MTEAEWLAAEDLDAMFEAIEHRASERKLRLFGVACCRRVPLVVDVEIDAVVPGRIDQSYGQVTEWNDLRSIRTDLVYVR